MDDNQKNKDIPGIQNAKVPTKNAYPPWVHVEKVSFTEKLEIKVYQIISLFPVMVTFGLYFYLLFFYLVVTFTYYIG